MKIEDARLRIAGMGAVSPGGMGLAALDHPELWPRSEMPSLSRPESAWTVCRVQEEVQKKWQTHPRLRRAGPVAYSMVESASQAMEGCTFDPKRVGVAVAFFTGGMVYTRKFYQGILKQGRKFASPALFPETVFNSPTSHLVSVLGLGGPVYSLAGDESSWVTAIMTAYVWLKNRDADAVLVIGAEELDAIAVEAYQAAGWLRKGPGRIPTEGAAALLLTLDNIEAVATISMLVDGFRFRNRHQAGQARTECLGALGNPVIGQENPELRKILAFTASAGWATQWLVRHAAQRTVGQLVRGCNHQVSGLILERVS